MFWTIKIKWLCNQKSWTMLSWTSFVIKCCQFETHLPYSIFINDDADADKSFYYHYYYYYCSYNCSNRIKENIIITIFSSSFAFFFWWEKEMIFEWKKKFYFWEKLFSYKHLEWLVVMEMIGWDNIQSTDDSFIKTDIIINFMLLWISSFFPFIWIFEFFCDHFFSFSHLHFKCHELSI